MSVDSKLNRIIELLEIIAENTKLTSGMDDWASGRYDQFHQPPTTDIDHGFSPNQGGAV